jgi:hypothetical protein
VILPRKRDDKTDENSAAERNPNETSRLDLRLQITRNLVGKGVVQVPWQNDVG